MNIERINLNLLIAFKILYEEKSVTRAANRLAVTQAAMSNTLRLLRNLFDDPLFIRESKGIKPTKKSDDLFSPVCRALESIENVFIHETFIPEDSVQCFRLALSDHGELMFLPRLVAHLRQKAPGVRLKVIRYNPTHREDFFLGRQVDCAIAIDPYLSGLLKSETLFSETGICVVHKGVDDRAVQLNLKQYMAAEHIAIAYSERSHETFIDKALASQQINRQVLLTVPPLYTTIFHAPAPCNA